VLSRKVNENALHYDRGAMGRDARLNFGYRQKKKQRERKEEFQPESSGGAPGGLEKHRHGEPRIRT